MNAWNERDPCLFIEEEKSHWHNNERREKELPFIYVRFGFNNEANGQPAK